MPNFSLTSKSSINPSSLRLRSHPRYMLVVPRMKSILNSKFSALSPCLCRTKTSPFVRISWASPSIICNNPFRIQNHLHLKSTPLSNFFICSIQSRSLHMEASRPPSSEIHVLVGPMFAGKTTTILRRIQSENSSGRKCGNN